jgi:dihydroorotate dehydrogenase
VSWFYRHCIRPILFTRDSEGIHNFTLKGLNVVSRNRFARAAIDKTYGAPELPVEQFGLRFPNPVGLAAGMDKQAAALPIWEKFGFGFCELGGVTWHPQPGNPKARMFRAVEDEALINRMGFNNSGAEAMVEKLSEWKTLGHWPDHPVGINLGKSKITPLERAAEDYANSFRVLKSLADFFVVNVSSPNTPNLRQLQDKKSLDEILAAIQEQNETLSKPILVKVAPDLSFDALDEILELSGPRRIAGIVATNTTITRPETSDRFLGRIYSETGGLSGRPLRYRSNEIIRHLYRQTGGKLPIIGVGGIFNTDDALAKIMAGASLVQIYTGLVYEGPAIAKGIVRGLNKHLSDEGFQNLQQVIGLTAR